MEKFISPRGENNDRGVPEMPFLQAEKFPRAFGYILLLSKHEPWVNVSMVWHGGLYGGAGDSQVPIFLHNFRPGAVSVAWCFPCPKQAP